MRYRSYYPNKENVNLVPRVSHLKMRDTGNEVGRMYRKSKCRSMQIKAFIYLITLAGKLPILALKEGKKE